MDNTPNKRKTNIGVSLIGQSQINKLKKDIEEHSKQHLHRYIVAYIDFLGTTKRMKNEKTCYDYLLRMKTLIESIKNKAHFIQTINHQQQYDIKYFSDNIVIAQKINEEELDGQIVSLLNLISLLQFEAFFSFNYPLRGGITISDLYIDDTIVWGTGLIEAYQLENNVAIYPRVIISSSIFNEIERLSAGKDISGNKKYFDSFIKKDKDGCWFVDYLQSIPSSQLIPKVSENLSNKASLNSKEDEHVKQKINWIISYFNDYCQNLNDLDNAKEYLVSHI